MVKPVKLRKQPKKDRINIYLDVEMSRWIRGEADKLGLTNMAFTRMLLIEAYNAKS